METKVGRVALITREFIVAEILELRPEGPRRTDESAQIRHFVTAFGRRRRAK